MALPDTLDMTRPDGTLLRHCLYGPADGRPVIWHNGSPSSRWKWPTLIESMRDSGLRILVYDRPGYGGSTRHTGRTVADAAADTSALADAHDWERFAVFGGSGGGPHALACAALLPERVTACAVLSGVRPADPGTPVPDEEELRTQIAGISAQIMGGIDDGAPELPGTPGPPARDDPDAMARLRATFVESMDGWTDDSLAFARPWGFEPSAITVPVGLWSGTGDTTVPDEHTEHLLAHIPSAQGHRYQGGHVPGPAVYDEIFTWLRTTDGS